MALRLFHAQDFPVLLHHRRADIRSSKINAYVFFHDSTSFLSGRFCNRHLLSFIIVESVNLHLAYIFIFLAYCAVSFIRVPHFSKNI